MQFLRQNTAVIITVGPFYDKGDGVTIETGLTITNERITLTADTDAGSAPTNILDNVTGATSGTANDLNYIANNDAGMMQLELAAADTNRVGRMMLSITDAVNHVPVFHEFFVLPQAIYDWLTGVIVPLPANVTQLSGDGTAADNAESFFDGTGYAGTNNVIPTVTTATNVTTLNGIAANVITATSIASDAIVAAKIATGAITNAKFAAGAIDAAAIANAAIDFATFAADCITGTGLKSNVESITANAITATAINADAITSAKIADDAISSEHLNTGAITADAFAANAIIAATLNAGVITNAKFAAGAIDAAAIANGAIDNATFAADVGSTAYATNIIALAADKAINNYDSPTNTEMVAAFTEIKGATFAATDTLEAIRDQGDSTWATATGFGTAIELAKVPKSDSDVSWNATALAAINAEVDTALNTAIPGSPTADSINERIVAIDAFGAPPSAATIKTAIEAAGSHLTLILEDSGTTIPNLLSALETHGDGAWATATGFSTHSAADVWAATNATLSIAYSLMFTRLYRFLLNKVNITDATGALDLYDEAGTGVIGTLSITDDATDTIRTALGWV